MLTVDLVDLANKKEIKEFYNLPFKIYKDIPQWVPPLYTDVRAMMDKKKHPFYEHSDADFFIARRGNDVVGRICALENRLFNKYHGTQQAQFYLFECINEQDVANALFEKVFEWARGRSLNEVVGPKGFSLFDGYGIQIEGFEHRQMMIMMNYNPAYYVQLVENLGFQKEVDFVSCYLDGKTFKVPDKVNLVAKRVQEKGTFFVKSFKDKKELSSWADRIGESYNNTFINNWEYYPISKEEIGFILKGILEVADHRLIKIILAGEKVIGFLFGFPDVSSALQRAKGKLTPWAILDLLREMKKTDWVSLNGAGILPEYQGLGGNALLYSEMEKTIKDYGFAHFELTQVAETAVQMRKDLMNVGGIPYKNHRVYFKHI